MSLQSRVVVVRRSTQPITLCCGPWPTLLRLSMPSLWLLRTPVGHLLLDARGTPVGYLLDTRGTVGGSWDAHGDALHL
jgi:hypothetical protein